MKACKSGIDLGLYLVTDRVLSGGRPLEQIVRESVAGGVTVVQLREKDAGAREFIEQAFALRQAASDLAIPLIINDRVDIALACRADGVHLGQGDMPCALARRIAGKDMIIGVSVSTADEALRSRSRWGGLPGGGAPVCHSDQSRCSAGHGARCFANYPPGRSHSPGRDRRHRSH